MRIENNGIRLALVHWDLSLPGQSLILVGARNIFFFLWAAYKKYQVMGPGANLGMQNQILKIAPPPLPT